MRIVLPLLLVTAAASTARADQCQIVDSKIATRAVELARKSTKVIELCEPCHDVAPRGPYRIVSADIRNGQVQINGRSVDLAYTFLHTSGDTYQNLATAAGCSAHGVSATIHNANPAMSPPPPPPPLPPRPPLPPLKRITSPDDIGGTWKVSIRPSVTTCSTQGSPPSTPTPSPTPSLVPPVPPVTWTITSTGGDVSVMTDDGHELIAKGATLARFNMLDLQLAEAKGTRRALKLHQFSMDMFDAKLVVVEQRSRTTCATAYDVYGRRAP